MYFFRKKTVEEVGQAMMTSMKVDKNGAVFSIMPDSPLIEFPNYRTTYGYLVSFGLGQLPSKLFLQACENKC
jgi:hypothetical protein